MNIFILITVFLVLLILTLCYIFIPYSKDVFDIKYGKSDIANLVIIHHGNTLPEYIIDFLEQARKFSPQTPIYFCVDENILENSPIKYIPNVHIVSLESIPKSELHKKFENSSKLDKEFRDKFWYYCSERFLTLYDFTKLSGLENIFHMEYDNLLYTDLQNLFMKMKNIPDYKDSAGIRDSDNEGVPSLIYFKDCSSVEKFVSFMVENEGTDMAILGSYIKNTNNMGTLPIMTREYADKLNLSHYEFLYKNSDILGMVFDGRAVGQYIGGIDPRNQGGDTKGFINKDVLFDVSQIKVELEENNLPRVCDVTIANLHIHSKNLKLYRK